MKSALITGAATGIAINTATALMFMRGRKDDLNIRGAFLHMAADAAGVLARNTADAAGRVEIRRQRGDELGHAVGGVDGDGLTRLAVADQVHEVHHLGRELVVDGGFLLS